MVKIHTCSNHTDMLTKVVLTAKFKVCLNIVKVCVVAEYAKDGQ